MTRRMTSGSLEMSIHVPSGTVAQAIARIGPITRQRTSLRAAIHMGVAATDSSSSTTGTAARGPSSNAMGGDMTIAPPNPVMPRTMPATAAMAAASASVSGAKEPTVHGDSLAGDEAGVLGGEEERGLGNVGTLGETPERDACDGLLSEARRKQVVRHRRIHHGGRDRIDPDSLRAQLAAQTLGERDHTRL